MRLGVGIRDDETNGAVGAVVMHGGFGRERQIVVVDLKQGRVVVVGAKGDIVHIIQHVCSVALEGDFDFLGRSRIGHGDDIFGNSSLEGVIGAVGLAGIVDGRRGRGLDGGVSVFVVDGGESERGNAVVDAATFDVRAHPHSVSGRAGGIDKDVGTLAHAK